MVSRSETPEPADKKTFAWRLWWVMKNRFDGNAAEMARACDLERSHIRNTIMRPLAELKASNAYKVAKGAGVSLAWLSSGDGQPDDPPPGEDFADPFPARREAVALARARKPRLVPETVIALARQLGGRDHIHWDRVRWAQFMAELALEHLQTSPEALQQAMREGGSEAIRRYVSPAEGTPAPEPAPKSRPAKQRRKAG